MLEELAARYRRDLTESVIPFWMKHSLDSKCGGYFSCLDRDGSVYDTKKYMWLQGRAVWMFSRLYNELEPRQEYLEAAALGADFIRRFGKDEKGRIYFSLARDGKPYFYQRKPFPAVFCMLGLLEYYRASGERECFNEAVGLFWRINEWIKDPALIYRPILAGQVRSSNLANVMVMACMAIELNRVLGDTRYVGIMRQAVDNIIKHYEPKRRILLENVPVGEDDMRRWPEGRLFLPGHSIEVAWFLLHLLEVLPDPSHQKLALDIIEGSLEFGWDKEFGGLYYMMDIEGRPVLQLEHSMKLWWVHTEAIYALMLAYSLTREDRWLKWLAKVDEYAYSHFVDKEFGGWFGYCDRGGNLTHTCKGGNYKGFFHVPRFLLMSIQEIEKMQGPEKQE